MILSTISIAVQPVLEVRRVVSGFGYCHDLTRPRPVSISSWSSHDPTNLMRTVRRDRSRRILSKLCPRPVVLTVGGPTWSDFFYLKRDRTFKSCRSSISRYIRLTEKRIEAHYKPMIPLANRLGASFSLLPTPPRKKC